MDIKPTYQGFSAQLIDKNTVVLQIGRRFTKCGFAGESCPRAIIKTIIHSSRGGSSTWLCDIKDRAILKENLRNFIEKIYFNHLAVSPKEKRVVIVESVFCKTIFRNTLTQVLFEQFNVPSIVFVPDHLMALASLGLNTGLVIDIGSEEAISIAVVGGVTLLDCAQFASLGAKTLDSLISEELIKRDPTLRDSLNMEIVEDIRIRTCFVAPFERGLKMTEDKYQQFKQSHKDSVGDDHSSNSSIQSMENFNFLSDIDEKSPSSVEYPIGGWKTIMIPGNLREGSCEVLFEIFGYEHSLTTMIIETIMMSPIDCRRALSENILVIGGLANLPGLEHRLSKELIYVNQSSRYNRKVPDEFRFHQAMCPKNYVSWLGASLFCNTSFVELRSTTRDQWIKDGKKCPKDWSDLIR